MTIPSWDTYPVIVDETQTLHRRDADAEKCAIDCLNRFMSSFNAQDVKGMRDVFNFPSQRLVESPPVMIEMDEAKFENNHGNGLDKPGKARPYLKSIGWSHSSIDRMHVVWLQSDKIHIDCCFTGYRSDEDGTYGVMGVFESFYIVTKDENGHWGVKLRSTSADSNIAKSKL